MKKIIGLLVGLLLIVSCGSGKLTDDEFEKIKNEYQDEIMDYKSQLIQLKVNRDANETGKNQQKIKKRMKIKNRARIQVLIQKIKLKMK